MRDIDVRRAIRANLEQLHGSDSQTRIVEEMGVWANTVRIDVAVINGELTGYELKSARDTLARLPFQAEIYGKVFDRLTLVAAAKHIDAATKVVPGWWGLVEASIPLDGQVELRLVRPSEPNPAPDLQITAELLWKAEAYDILEMHGLARGYRSKPLAKLHQRLAQELRPALLREEVRLALKRRENWLGQEGSNQLHVSVHAQAHPVAQSLGSC